MILNDFLPDIKSEYDLHLAIIYNIIHGSNTFQHQFFMPPLRSSRRHYVFGLSVRPSVRLFVPSVHPYVPFSWWRYLKNRLMDSCQTLIMYVSCRADELIRFWGHEVKGHRAHYICKNSLWSRYLKNRLMDSCQTLVLYVSCRADELIRFWGHEVKGQRSQGSLYMQIQLVIALSQEPIDGFLPNLVCYLQRQWTN